MNIFKKGGCLTVSRAALAFLPILVAVGRYDMIPKAKRSAFITVVHYFFMKIHRWLLLVIMGLNRASGIY